MSSASMHLVFNGLALLGLGLVGLHGCATPAASTPGTSSRIAALHSPTLDEQPISVGEVPAGTTVRDVLLRMDATYGSCRSYSDRVLQRIELRGLRRITCSVTFATNFVRGGGFRLDMKLRFDTTLLDERHVSQSQIVVWGDNASAREWWPQGSGTSETRSLGVALAHSAASTNEASWTVPSLLLPSVVSMIRLPGGPVGALALLDDPKLVGVESFAGHECFKLERIGERQSTHMWIDRESCVLRRIHSTTVRDDGTVSECLTVYDPKLDVDIAPSAFEFEPPK